MGMQYKVSELMDNYTDTELLPDLGQGADTYKILNGVKEKIKSKKHLRLGAKILAAAAAAIAVIFTVTATSSPVSEYTSLLGVEYRFSWQGSSSTTNYIEPYMVEDGRVFFTADGQYIDITDLIRDNNVYLYEYKGIDSHGLEVLNYIGVAGTPDDLGFGEIVLSADFVHCSLECYNSYDIYYLFDGEEIHKKNLTAEQYAVRTEHLSRQEDKSWWENFERTACEIREKYSQVSGDVRVFSISRYGDCVINDLDV